MMAQDFLDHGYTLAGDSESGDVTVINTCTVTGRTDSKCRQAIRQAQRANPDTTVVVTGCYSQVSAAEIQEIPGVDYVIGVNDKLSLFDFFPGPGKRDYPEVQVSEIHNQREEKVHDSGDFRENTRAFLKIQSGCNRRCSYCIVPIARGPSRSLKETEVLAQAKRLIGQGFREIVLTGVHVGDFGKDRQLKSALPDLMIRLLTLSPGVRWRLSSLDPDDLDETLIHVVSDNDQICRHFHMALQSGSETILKAMNRRHTAVDFRKKMNRLTTSLKTVGLGTDIIVGFPGETETLFEETVDFVRSLPFSYFHVFPFSARQGTAAAAMDGQVPPRVRLERARFLRSIGTEKKRHFVESFFGKTVEILFESKQVKGRMGGFSSEYLRVEVPFQRELVNRIVPVHVEGIKGAVARGRVPCTC